MISVTLTMTRLLVPDGVVFVFQNLLISWDFQAQQSIDFTQNDAKKTKHPVYSGCVGETSVNEREWSVWFKLISLQ